MIPDLDLGCYLKVRDLLAGKIKDLGLRPGSCVIISGFLTTFKGIKSFLNSEFNLDVFISLKQGLTSERLLNKALNSSIKGEGLLRANINDTSEYVISLKRTTRMLE